MLNKKKVYTQKSNEMKLIETQTCTQQQFLTKTANSRSRAKHKKK